MGWQLTFDGLFLVAGIWVCVDDNSDVPMRHRLLAAAAVTLTSYDLGQLFGWAR